MWNTIFVLERVGATKKQQVFGWHAYHSIYGACISNWINWETEIEWLSKSSYRLLSFGFYTPIGYSKQ
jgi:hypothetical protein